ncbi:hypothetical protein RHGRI_025807 [Rhododendron griersonianum]|uniref:Uncharacterized protein n=1 Tax=Rhododendron griersonianum TaxID=479676 RepID=A0AAV6ISW4_9ERIC|nr:hypothetical protein RHGRI_025807 [Rhododendron griersonianum]
MLCTWIMQINVDALHLDYADKCILELSRGTDQSASNLGEHMKAAFGSSWKEVLCEKQLLEGKIDPGSPALLVISLSALRSLELLSSGVRLSTFVVEGDSDKMCKTEKNLGRMLCARTLLPLILHGRCSLPGWLSRGEVLGGYHVLADVECLDVGLLRSWNPLVVQCKFA